MSRRDRNQRPKPRSAGFASGADRRASADLVVALSPDLTGRVHLAYRRRPDRRWWRLVYPGWSVPRWDYVSLCGRRGLIPGDAWRDADCRSCRRLLAGRRARLARRLGDSE
jgi:hypothetical protein